MKKKQTFKNVFKNQQDFKTQVWDSYLSTLSSNSEVREVETNDIYKSITPEVIFKMLSLRYNNRFLRYDAHQFINYMVSYFINDYIILYAKVQGLISNQFKKLQNEENWGNKGQTTQTQQSTSSTSSAASTSPGTTYGPDISIGAGDAIDNKSGNKNTGNATSTSNDASYSVLRGLSATTQIDINNAMKEFIAIFDKLFKKVFTFDVSKYYGWGN